MATVLAGTRTKSGPQRDREGHRTYQVKHLVKVDPDTEGGYAVLQAAGLPQPGSIYDFDGDTDPWAFCQPDADVRVHQESEGERPEFYVVEQTFSTRPTSQCNDQPVEDPLLQPMRVSGSFRNTREESTFDRYGKAITNSAHELIRGRENEWDVTHATVEIEQNVPDLELDLCTFMQNRVNMFPMWGVDARCVKLSSFSWEKKYHAQCYTYYMRRFTLDVEFEGFDRDILDEATKCLRGKWVSAETEDEPAVYALVGNPDRFKPSHFIRYIDPNGNPGKCVLNGEGLPSGACVTNQQGLTDMPVRYYVAAGIRTTMGQNTGLSLLNRDAWVELISGPTPYPWSGAYTYVRGNVVTFNGAVYLALCETFLEQPGTAFNWLLLPAGLNGKGEYDETTTYVLGDFVNTTTACGVGFSTGTGGGSSMTDTGYIHVEKYLDGNLLLLGLPAFL